MSTTKENTEGGTEQETIEVEISQYGLMAEEHAEWTATLNKGDL